MVNIKNDATKSPGHLKYKKKRNILNRKSNFTFLLNISTKQAKFKIPRTYSPNGTFNQLNS